MGRQRRERLSSDNFEEINIRHRGKYVNLTEFRVGLNPLVRDRQELVVLGKDIYGNNISPTTVPNLVVGRLRTQTSGPLCVNKVLYRC